MVVRVTNAQREAPVALPRMQRLARRAVRSLQIRTPGLLAITFITGRRIRALNRRFLRHDWETDVLSFRYEAPPRRDPRVPVGEILIAPRQARRYARTHDIPYEQELARYVVHGLLHWLGEEDATAKQQQRMRRMEDRLLRTCNGHLHR
jgi:probable rRNA maturation factor